MDNELISIGMPIWTYLSDYFGSNKNEERNFWCLIVKQADTYFKISPCTDSDIGNGLLQYDANELENSGVDLSSMVDPSYVNGRTIVPITFFDKPIFYIFIEMTLMEHRFRIFKRTIEALLNLEGLSLSVYPSYLPFLLPFNDPEVKKINTYIQIKSEFYFLNGLPGTGKHTFIKNHLMYCYEDNAFEFNPNKSADKGKIQFFAKGRNSIILVDELAYCTEIEQQSLLQELKTKKRGSIIFICSAYDPAILCTKGIIKLELAELCLSSRIIFPSVQKRGYEIKELFAEYLSMKGVRIPHLMLGDWVGKQDLGNGFIDIITIVQNVSYPYYLLNSFNEGNSIRDIVKEIEIRSLDYAIKVVGKSQNKIANFLGISRGSLQHKLKKYNYSYSEWEE